jgi:hypothetical protein
MEKDTENKRRKKWLIAAIAGALVAVPIAVPEARPIVDAVAAFLALGVG